MNNYGGRPNGSDGVQNDAWNDPKGPIQVMNVRSPRRTAEQPMQAEKPQNRPAYDEPEVTNETNDLVEAERNRDKGTWPYRVKKALGATAVALVAAGVILAADKEPNQPMTKEAWEETAQKGAGSYDADFDYNENGHSIITIKDIHNGVQTQYYLDDIDNDTLIERGHTSNQNGGAEIAVEDGTTIKDAIYRLNVQMDKQN